jgi:HSP20 family molecular chaperone IbpA
MTVRAAPPGYSAKDIEIHVEPQRAFTIGQPQEKSKKKNGKINDSEQRSNRICRSIDLLAQIDAERLGQRSATASSKSSYRKLRQARRPLLENSCMM